MREECASFAEKLTGVFSDIVVKTMTVQLLRELEELDLSLSQLHALTHVAEARKCSVGGLAEALGVTHPAAVKLAEKLARKGLLTRGVDPVDHRQTELCATPEGRTLINRVREERAYRLEQVFSRMSADERQALITGLQGFVTAATRNEGALDHLCMCCQTLLPTECDDFRLLTLGSGKELAGAA